MKKVFIVYASAGAGHKKAAIALYEYLQKTSPEVESKIVDILDYATGLFRFFYSKGYIFVISKLPYLWYFFYRLSFLNPNNKLRYWFESLNGIKFIKLLQRENPDVLVSTHFLTGNLLSLYKKEFPLSRIRHISIVTDYILHPFWINESVDTYIVASEAVKDELVEKGVSSNKIKIYGIPVSHKFYLEADRNLIAQKLNIDPLKFTVLIMTGTVGIGPIEEIVEHLASDAQLLVVCGTNEKLYKRIAKMSLSSVKICHLVDNVDELMSVSSVILTKAGGLTITESIVKRLPLVFFSSIPGLETANADIICGYGVALKMRDISEIRELILSFKNKSPLYLQVYNNIGKLRKPDTLPNIANEIKTGNMQ